MPFDLIASAEPNYLWDISKILGSTAFGAMVTHLTYWWKGRNKKTLICIGNYCPVSSTANSVDFTFLVRRAGKETINNVRMKITCNSGERIGKVCFKVDESLLCERISWDGHGGTHVACTWSYINAGDVLHLVFPVRNCQKPEDVRLEIDGIETTVKRKKTVENCIPCE